MACHFIEIPATWAGLSKSACFLLSELQTKAAKRRIVDLSMLYLGFDATHVSVTSCYHTRFASYKIR